MAKQETVDVINKAPFEIVLPTDYVDEKGKLVPNPVKYSVKGEAKEGRSITLPHTPMRSFETIPVTLPKAEWERMEKHAAIQGFLNAKQIEVR